MKTVGHDDDANGDEDDDDGEGLLNYLTLVLLFHATVECRSQCVRICSYSRCSLVIYS